MCICITMCLFDMLVATTTTLGGAISRPRPSADLPRAAGSEKWLHTQRRTRRVGLWQGALREHKHLVSKRQTQKCTSKGTWWQGLAVKHRIPYRRAYALSSYTLTYVALTNVYRDAVLPARCAPACVHLCSALEGRGTPFEPQYVYVYIYIYTHIHAYI